MEITKRKEKESWVVAVKGRLDAVTSPELEKELTALIQGGEKRLVLDLGDLAYISSAGLRIILAVTKRIKEKNGKLILASLGSVVKQVFEISGFTSIIPIVDSVDSAILEMG